MRQRRITISKLLLLATVITVLVTPGQAIATQDAAPDVRTHSTGLTLIDYSRHARTPLPENLAQALHRAWDFVEKHPDAFGYPWIDPEGKQLVLDAVGPVGKRLASSYRETAGAAARVREVKWTFNELERIKNEVIDLTSAEVPDGDAVFATIPDGEHNRIIVNVERVSDALLSVLAARYGTDSIAIQHVPNRPKTSPHADRDHDGSSFWGGSTIYVPEGICTSGFPWISGSTYMMVTAGHCAPNGGSVSTPVEHMGSVDSGSRENWNNGTGTVYMTGQSTYRGDIALIRIPSGKYSAIRIYRGPPGAGTQYGATVKEMWSRRASDGDQYCTGGRVTGEMCGWNVDWVRANVEYSGGEVVRDVVIGSKYGQCTLDGDSGAPTYTVRADGGIAAKGIHSGGGGGGTDEWGGYWDPCIDYFTDIWNAYYGFPGVLRTG